MNGLYPATSMPDRDWWAALWPDPAGTLRSLGVRPGMTAVDLCCGDGYFTAALAGLLDGRVYALDLDPAMIARARAELAAQDRAVLGWLNADAGEVASLLPDPVDFVLLANTFHGVPDQPALLRAIARVVKPAGLLAVVNWRPLPREATPVLGQPRGPRTEMRMSPEAVEALAGPAGFRPQARMDLRPYHYGVVLERQA
ncbi:class I SAM-dependent methyltransferase [Geminicoccus roseus]|uniref:class I SAM-dependent methyltransferase n=1 Tax=Geminicoccus roseus TaxID=404900 RepID=UPI000422B525|nr:class I SAM-dependent methyltransferase [Geminicoccus roseus]